jgi:pimeloyl-ACP methyl ester carboxylesterase
VDPLTTKSRKSCLGTGLRILAWLAGVLAVILLGLFLWQVVASARENQQYPMPGKLYDVNGLQMHLYCTGDGSPTIILDSGLGGPGFMWELVQNELSKTYRVCSYDRAGLGWSQVSKVPRTTQNIVLELHDLLQAASEKGPFILIGHSFGGFTVRVFTKQYPKEVKGIILVGAGHEDFDQRLPPGCKVLAQSNVSFARLAQPLTRMGIMRLAGSIGLLTPLTGEMLNGVPADLQSKLMAKTFYTPQYWQTFVAEMTSLDESEAQVRDSGNLDNLPLVVVSGSPDVSRVPGSCNASSVVALSKELQAELAKLSSNSYQITCDTCGHYIPLTDPQLVVEAVKQLSKESTP